MEVVQPGFPTGDCRSDLCAHYLVAVSAVSAATLIVSGSIVVIGNSIHWLERVGSCPRDGVPATGSDRSHDSTTEEWNRGRVDGTAGRQEPITDEVVEKAAPELPFLLQRSMKR